MTDSNRRAFLSVTAAMGSIALAGCTSSLPFMGGDGSPTVAFEEWIPEIDEQATVSYGDIGAFVDSGVPEDATAELVEGLPAFEDDVVSLDADTTVAGIETNHSVYATTVSRDELESRVAAVGESTSDDPAPDGYAAYTTSNGAYWIGDEYFLYGASKERLQAIHETKTGSHDRFADTALYESLEDYVTDAAFFVVSPTNSESNVDGYSLSWTFEGDTATLSFVLVWPDADAAANSDVTADSTLIRVFDDYEFSTETDGKRQVFTATTAIEDVGFGGDGESERETAPQLSLEFDYDRGSDGEWNGSDDESIRVTHGGGEVVEKSVLTIQYDGTPIDEHAGISVTEPDGESVQAGDYWTLRPADGADPFDADGVVRVVWQSSSSDRSATLAETVLP